MSDTAGLQVRGSDLDALQEVFRYAASTVGERTLGGKVLRWKPGKIDQAKALLAAAKANVDSEFRVLNQSRPDWLEGYSSDAPPPAPGRARSDAVVERPPGFTAAAAATGGWQAARPSPNGARPAAPVMGGHRVRLSVFGDAGAAALKGGGGMLVADGLLGLQEGALQGANLFYAPRVATAAAFKALPEMKPDPALQAGLNGFADGLRSSGILEAATEDTIALAQDVISCLPAIGAAMTLTKAVIHSVNAGLDWYKFYRSKQLMPFVTAGLPREALGEVQDLLRRKAADQTARAGINTVAGALQTAGLFADMGAATGPAVGIAKACAELALTITVIMVEFREMRQGNKILMRGGPYDRHLLKACPILACYVLTNCESSTLFAFLAERPLRSATDQDPGWMGEVDRALPQIEEVRRLANYCQRTSPFLLPGINDAEAPILAPLSPGDHFLDFRIHKTHQRFLWEAKMIGLREPRNIHFLKRKFGAEGGVLMRILTSLKR